jgi:hypothetical protein
VKQFRPITSTYFGTQNEKFSDLCEIEYSPIRDSLHPGSKVRNMKLFILPRAPPEVSVCDAGRESDSNLSHPQNASDSIVSSSEGESKTIEDSAEQRKKQFFPRERIVPGRQIDFSEEQTENADFGISTSCDLV